MHQNSAWHGSCMVNENDSYLHLGILAWELQGVGGVLAPSDGDC